MAEFERRAIMGGAGLLAAMAMAGPVRAQPQPPRLTDPDSLRGSVLDLTTPRGNREAWARLLGNTDMRSTKYGWAEGLIQGVRPGEAVRDLVGFTMLSTARLLPNPAPEGGYRKVLREIGLCTDLRTGEVLERWRNPYLDEEVRVVHIMNDPFNHSITDFYPDPPSYGGLNPVRPPRVPLQLDWTRRGDTLNLFSHINLFYPSALQPDRWPRESAHPFAQVTEVFLYQIPWAAMQSRRTSVTYNGTWARTTPWLPWMLMGPTPGHCQYHTFMGARDRLQEINPRTVAWVRANAPKFLEAPAEWEEPSLSSLELYAREQQPAPVTPGQPVPRAPEPELPAWFRQVQQQRGG